MNHLDPAFRAKLLKPGDSGHDAARQVHSGVIDKLPALIARCSGVADVVDAIKLGVESNLEIWSKPVVSWRAA